MGAIATDAIILITYILIILLAAFILWMIIDVRNNVRESPIRWTDWPHPNLDEMAKPITRVQ